MSSSVSHWFPRNWFRAVGLPTPEAPPWALRDVPISRSVLESLKRMGCVELVERDKFVPRSRTQRASNQCVYETTRTGWDALVKYSNLSERVLQRFSGDPDADLLLGDLVGSDHVQEAVEHVEDTTKIDIQVLDLAGVDEPVRWACPVVDVVVIDEGEELEWVEHDERIKVPLSESKWRERLLAAACIDDDGSG